MSDGKDLLGVAGSQLERMGIPINLLGKAAERVRERKKEKSEVGVTNSAINTATNNTQSTTNVDGSGSSTTSNTSLTQSNITNPIESNVEKLNPSVAGNPTTAQPEPKTDVAISQPTAPVTPTQSSPSMAEVKPQKPISLTPTNQPAASQAPPMIDVASLENRLKRIEQALTNPLEVIIKES
jgi:apolipoprotein N-acyltransferase